MTPAPEFIRRGHQRAVKNAKQRDPLPANPKGLALLEPVFRSVSRTAEGPGPETAPYKRRWVFRDIYRTLRRSLLPCVRSRVLPGQFHSITHTCLYLDYATTSVRSVGGVGDVTQD